SEYDTKIVQIIAVGGIQKSQNGLTIFTTLTPSSDNESTADLAFDIEVNADNARNLLQFVVIGAFVAAPGVLALQDNIVSWRTPVMVVMGLIAGFATVFGFRRS